jgi:hypothetical protein
MDRTAESYRISLEQEISRWNGFVRALRKDDREAFEELMEMGRSFATEGSNATQPATFEPMVMSILLAHQKNLQELECKLNELLWKNACIKAPPEPKSKL